MANKVVLGSDLMLFTSNASSGSYKALGAATSCKLTIQANVLETSSKDSGCWVAKQVGKLSWNGSSENLFIMADYAELVETMLNRDTIYIQFATIPEDERTCEANESADWTVNANGGVFSGEAIITSIDMNAADGENATYSISLEGVGALTIKKPTA